MACAVAISSCSLSLEISALSLAVNTIFIIELFPVSVEIVIEASIINTIIVTIRAINVIPLLVFKV